jgi:hypothetical protein
VTRFSVELGHTFRPVRNAFDYPSIHLEVFPKSLDGYPQIYEGAFSSEWTGIGQAFVVKFGFGDRTPFFKEESVDDEVIFGKVVEEMLGGDEIPAR